MRRKKTKEPSSEMYDEVKTVENFGKWFMENNDKRITYIKAFFGDVELFKKVQKLPINFSVYLTSCFFEYIISLPEVQNSDFLVYLDKNKISKAGLEYIRNLKGTHLSIYKIEEATKDFLHVKDCLNAEHTQFALTMRSKQLFQNDVYGVLRVYKAENAYYLPMAIFP
ncbi:MAG: hypothetical protein IJU76_13405 [Desulfovibrionaceae bacterium]|nr:hypothetical protein [Desulfovibrionaceae bacterium]